MKLLTKELINKMPKIYAQQNAGENAICYVKLFTPWSFWTWYVMEYDAEEELCFGYVEGFEKELGYFSLAELREIKGPAGLKVERDISFSPKKLSEIR